MRLPRLAHALTVAAAALAITPATAQSGAPDTIVVFDGSGSMWGQIDGRSKIEIARDTLSSVLSESVNDMRIGMIAYGHREKGQCSDIETVVPVGPAQSTVPRMIDAARSLNPKGKTPLTDAVRRAADELRFTENAATVVLVTDGIETCKADPCALASELERSGIDFTAHVVGFGLSDEEGQEVQCLADETGGLYIQANDASDLSDALQRTIEPIPVNANDFVDDGPMEREVHFFLRDSDDTFLLGQRELVVIMERDDGMPVAPDAYELNYPEAAKRSLTATLEPGSYRLLVTRDTDGSGGYRAALPFEVPAGDGTHRIEASLSGALIINPFLNPTLAFDPADPPGSARDKAWAYFHVFPIKNGTVAAEPVVDAYKDLRFPLPAGDYLIRATLDRAIAAEQRVSVGAGAPTEVDFSFDVTPVTIDLRDEDGFPRESPIAFVYDTLPGERDHFTGGRYVENPIYLPTGTWGVDAGAERRGTRSQTLIEVPGDFQPIRLRMDGTETLPEDAASRITACAARLRVEYEGCLMTPDAIGNATANDAALDGLAPQPEAVQEGNLAEPNDALEANDPVQANDAPVDVAAIDPTAPVVSPNATVPNAGPADLAGLSGNAYAFATASGDVLAHIVIDGGSEAATLVLSNGWCGASDCAGQRLNVPRDEVSLLEGDEVGAVSLSVPGATINLVSLGEDKEMRAASGERKQRLTLLDRIVLAAAPSQGGAESPAAQTPRFAFAAPGTAAEAMVIDFPDGPQRPARVALAAGWCGDAAACPAETGTYPVTVKAVEMLGAGRAGMGLPIGENWDGILVTIAPDGDAGAVLVEDQRTGRSVRMVRTGSADRAELDTVEPGPAPSRARASSGGLPTMAYVSFGNDHEPEQAAFIRVGPDGTGTLYLTGDWCASPQTDGDCSTARLPLGPDILSRLAETVEERVEFAGYTATLNHEGRAGLVHISRPASASDVGEQNTLAPVWREDMAQDYLIVSHQRIVPTSGGFPIPQGTAGLAGKGFAFANDASVPLLLVLPETGDGTALLSEGWCGAECPEQRLSVPRTALSKLQSGSNETLTLLDAPTRLRAEPVSGELQLVAGSDEGDVTFVSTGTEPVWGARPSAALR